MGMNKHLYDIWTIQQRDTDVHITLDENPQNVATLEYETIEEAQIAFDATWRTMDALVRLNKGSVRPVILPEGPVGVSGPLAKTEKGSGSQGATGSTKTTKTEKTKE